MKRMAMKEKSLPAPWYHMVHSEGISVEDRTGATIAPVLANGYFFLA
jgi:hypothetical protein